MVNKRGREGRVQGHGVLPKQSFSSFTRCPRRSFLYVDGVLDDGRDGVMFLLALRRLRRYLFVYLSGKFSTSCLNAFRRALFALSVFYAIWLYFQLFRKIFRRVFLIFLFYSGVSPPCPAPLSLDPEHLCGQEWELNDEEIAALDLQGAASPMEVEGDLSDMNAEEMAKEGFYLVKSVLRHRYRQGWHFLTLWGGFEV